MLIGSGLEVVAVFSTGTTSAGCDAGAEVDTAGLAQAESDITIKANREMICFTVPLLCDKKGRTSSPPSPDIVVSFY